MRLIDTAGAYPGIGAEERGQAEAIARSTEACLEIGVPNIALIIGEGGSGGAIAIATANRVLMLEHAIYSVISPEGAASILWRDTSKAQDAASNMKITAQDLLRFGVVDVIVPEPTGGAHREPAVAMAAAGEAIGAALGEFRGLDRSSVIRRRRENSSPSVGPWAERGLPTPLATCRRASFCPQAAGAAPWVRKTAATILPGLGADRVRTPSKSLAFRPKSRIIYHTLGGAGSIGTRTSGCLAKATSCG